MKIIAMSDSHGETAAMHEIVQKHRTADLIAFCGDGSSDIAAIRSMFPDKAVLAVRGNCDWYCDLPYYQEIELCGKKIMITHGHLLGVMQGYQRIIDYGHSNGIDIMIFGHTHKQMTSVEGRMLLVNPGSVGYSRKYTLIEIDDQTGKMTATEYPDNMYGPTIIA